LRDEAEGDTTIAIVIGTSGRVESCAVAESSGNADLDWTSCAIVSRRFVFMPALNEKGEAVPEQRQQRIRWILPDPEPVCGDTAETICPPAPPPPPSMRPPAPMPVPPMPLYVPQRAPPVARFPSSKPWVVPELPPPLPPGSAEKPR
jgi:TonB family protein